MEPAIKIEQNYNSDPEETKSDIENEETKADFIFKEDFCLQCHKQFYNQENFTLHLKICNPTQLLKVGINTTFHPNLENTDAKPKFKCRICSRSFTSLKCLTKHEYLHQTDPDNPKLAKATKKKEGPNVPKGNYKCEKCECKFRVYSALERHMEAHLLSASISSKSSQKVEITDHQTNDLKDGSVMRCSICDVAYNTFGMYRLHMQQNHEKSFNCDECGKKFTLPSTLKKHKLNYHTQFPKSCDTCGHFCATKDDFKTHMANVHGDGMLENTVPCEICGKLVKNKYILKQHVRLVHEKKGAEFPCEQCGKVMKSKASLEYHSKVHSGEKTFR